MVAPTMTKRYLQADFLTPSYRIVGEVQVGASGFMGVLNDEASSLLGVRAANMARAHMPTKLVDIYEVIRLVKSQILAVCLKRREDVGPLVMGQRGYTTITSFPVWLTTDVYEIQGSLEWAGHFDFPTIMGEGKRDFIPLYDATLTLVLVPSVKVECPVVLFNRRFVSTMALVKQRQKWE